MIRVLRAICWTGGITDPRERIAGGEAQRFGTACDACRLNKDESRLAEIFSDDIVYSECYGPEYKGKEQILRRFREWNRKGTVKQCIEQNNICVAEWYFKYEYEGITYEI